MASSSKDLSQSQATTPSRSSSSTRTGRPSPLSRTGSSSLGQRQASMRYLPRTRSASRPSRRRGKATLVYLVREGDRLPKNGRETFKAGNSLRAGSPGSLKFKVWEGDIADPVSDNRFVGLFEIKGSDFSDGVIAPGGD